MNEATKKDRELAELAAAELEGVSGGKSLIVHRCEVCKAVISSATNVRNNGVCDTCKKEGRSAGGASGGW